VTRARAHDAYVDDPTGGFSALTTAPYAALSTQPVADLDRWKAAWDAHASERREAGFLGHLINRAEDDPNLVTVLLPLADLERAKAFAASPDRDGETLRYGAAGPPEVRWLELLRTAPVWDRQLPALLLRARVADVDRWLVVYDGAAELLESAGIVGHIAARALDDPQLTVVHHQAESFDALRALLADPGIEPLMAAAGVLSPPDVRFQTSGWATTYRPRTDTQRRTESAREEHR